MSIDALQKNGCWFISDEEQADWLGEYTDEWVYVTEGVFENRESDTTSGGGVFENREFDPTSGGGMFENREFDPTSGEEVVEEEEEMEEIFEIEDIGWIEKIVVVESHF